MVYHEIETDNQRSSLINLLTPGDGVSKVGIGTSVSGGLSVDSWEVDGEPVVVFKSSPAFIEKSILVGDGEKINERLRKAGIIPEETKSGLAPKTSIPPELTWDPHPAI